MRHCVLRSRPYVEASLGSTHGVAGHPSAKRQIVRREPGIEPCLDERTVPTGSISAPECHFAHCSAKARQSATLRGESANMRVPSPPMALDDDQRRRLGRALWRYTDLSQPDFAKEAGIEYNRLRGAFNEPAKSPPTTEELQAMCAVAKVPEALAVYGWAAADPVAHLQQRVDQLQRDLGDQVGAVRRTVAELARRVGEIERGSSAARQGTRQ